MSSQTTSSTSSKCNTPRETQCLTQRSSTTTSSRIQFLNLINKSRFSLYLVQVSEKKYAMKIFPYDKGQISNSFRIEASFSWVDHPSIIKMVNVQPHKKVSENKTIIDASYIIMEYAPYGDFADLIIGDKFPKDEVLVRTYFHQLIEGLDYLHSNGVAHMDLKLENLLLGEDFSLKIADFDYSVADGQNPTGKGTENYRAPEVKRCQCKDPKKADIYSAGIILFCLMSRAMPYSEANRVPDKLLYSQTITSNEQFWKTHPVTQKNPDQFSKEFRNLFMSMVKENPNDRISIEEIKKDPWFTGPVYSPEELKAEMSAIYKESN